MMKNYISLLKKSIVTLALVSGTLLGLGGIAHAQPYGTPAPTTPGFNIYTGVPNGVGDESDFVRLRHSTGDPKVPVTVTNTVDPLDATCNVGDKFDIRTYVHNGAATESNENGTGTGVAHNTSVAMTAPLGKAGKQFIFKSTISASNAEAKADNGTLNCGNNVELKLVPSTVKVYSAATQSWTDALDSSVNGTLKLGSPVVGSGDMWACWENRIMVVYVVEVIPVPQVPQYSCDALVVERIGDLKKERNYKYTVSYTAKNGATLKSAVYNFGDNSATATVTSAPFSTTHSYASDGSYNTTATLTFSVNGQDSVVPVGKCATTINTSVEVPCATNPSLPKDSPECAVCIYNPNLPKNSPECKAPVTSIPSTGVGTVGIAGGLLGTSAIGYAVYAYTESRRALKKHLNL